MKIIAVANQKGGIGKTTTSINLATILKEKGYKTLLVDMDPQCNATDTYRAVSEGTETIYDVILDDDKIPAEEAIQHTEVGDIIAGDQLLRNADEVLRRNADGLFLLKDALSKLTNYDYIVLDAAPGMNTLLFSVLVAADDVIIPITADSYAIQGLSQLLDTINGVKRLNPEINVAGLLFVKFNGRTILAQEVYDSMKVKAKDFNTKVFNATIRESNKVKEAQSLKQSLIKYAPNSTSAMDYVEFINEYLGDKNNG